MIALIKIYIFKKYLCKKKVVFYQQIITEYDFEDIYSVSDVLH